MTGQPFFIPSVLMLLLSVPLVLGLVPRNRFYGIRTAKTLADERSWQRANRYGGRLLILSSAVYLSVALIFPDPAAGANHPQRWLLHLGAFVLPLLVSLLLIRRCVRSL
jgi:SdpI/YfhL protein family